MKRKPAKRKTAPEIIPMLDSDLQPDLENVIYVRVGDDLVPAKRLRRVSDFKPFSGEDQFGRPVTIDAVYDVEERCPFQGIDVPDDVDDLFARDGGRIYEAWRTMVDQTRAVGDKAETEGLIETVRWIALRAVETGFYLALMRYADDLKSSAEAGPILERLRKNAKKGGAARRKKAAPTHKAICKRFRELRKTVPKKTARYLRIAGEFGMSEGQIRRIISDAGID